MPEEEISAYYAKRTQVEHEVLPGQVANCVTAIASDEFSHSIGLLVPVDAGVAAFPGRLG